MNIKQINIEINALRAVYEYQLKMHLFRGRVYDKEQGNTRYIYSMYNLRPSNVCICEMDIITGEFINTVEDLNSK